MEQKQTVEEAAKAMQPFEKQVTEILYKNSSDDSECMRINFGTVPKIIDAIVKAGAEWAASLPTNSIELSYLKALRIYFEENNNSPFEKKMFTVVDAAIKNDKSIRNNNSNRWVKDLIEKYKRIANKAKSELMESEYGGVLKYKRECTIILFQAFITELEIHQDETFPTESWVIGLILEYNSRIDQCIEKQMEILNRRGSKEIVKKLLVKESCYREFITSLKRKVDESAPTEPNGQ